MAGLIFFPTITLVKAAVSLQRLEEYDSYKIHEKPFKTPKAKDDWPQRGEIIVENMSVRYRAGLPLVLDGISFKIDSSQKVAIVGRTGSGKSTSLLALMRILEMAEDQNGKPLGKILIDGVPIDQIGLHELRSNLSIIPQDPFLMKGSIKFNVDPKEQYTDERIVEVLEQVSFIDTIKAEDIINQKVQKVKDALKTRFNNKPEAKKKQIQKKYGSTGEFLASQSVLTIAEDPEIKRIKQKGVTNTEKLLFEIESKGTNLSIGQRQLLCIARAIISQPKILLMDEATSNIDQKTDSVIQTLIKEKLTNTTVVTIAHRLITIIQYDKLIILENGKKIEEGSPLELIQNGGYFCSLVEEGGDEFKKNMIYCATNKHVDPSDVFG